VAENGIPLTKMVPDAAGEGVEEVLKAAEAGFAEWSALPARDRRLRVRGLRRAIVRRQDEIARTVAAETAKPVTEVLQQEVTAACGMLAFLEKRYPGWLEGRKFRFLRPGFWLKSNRVLFEPLGTIAVIGPSNYPFSLSVMQAAAALLAGNAVILKPSERCPSTALLIGSLFAEAGLPGSAFGLCPGGSETGERLVRSPVVRKVLFTGSPRAGRKVAELCGRHFKPCLLELGGGQPALVLEDADPELAARGLAWSAGYAGSRSCVGTKTIFVHAAIKDEFLGRLAREIAGLRSGEPEDAGADIATPRAAPDPLIREALLRTLERGAWVRTAAGRTRDLAAVTWDRPVLVEGVDPSMATTDIDEWPERLVLVREVTTADQAVREANLSGLGLGASIWGRDMRRARAVARRLETGLVWINDSSVGLPDFPWGGTKGSGWGRLFSREALSELTNVKVISSERRRTSARKFWWFPYSPAKYRTAARMNEFLFGRRSLRGLVRFLTAGTGFLVRSRRKP
jgi:acyl-CoA reductase-like NAD-dependent aldehyde dehydrogenase